MAVESPDADEYDGVVQEEQETETPEETTEPPETDTPEPTTTETEGPGFGIAISLIALLGAGLLAARRFELPESLRSSLTIFLRTRAGERLRSLPVTRWRFRTSRIERSGQHRRSTLDCHQREMTTFTSAVFVVATCLLDRVFDWLVEAAEDPSQRIAFSLGTRGGLRRRDRKRGG